MASPLGAWLLLALCGPAATGRTRDELAGVLGVDPSAAARLAADLLGTGHDLVLSAAAVWNRPADGLAGWLAGLPPAVTRGDLPDQATLDTWAREHTDGLIERFPLEITPQTLLVLATALATRVSWRVPFETVPAPAGGAWAGLRRMLRAEPGRGHQQFIATVDGLGDVIVHTAQARPADRGDGLQVTSVAAAPDAPPGDVLAAAYDLAVEIATGRPVLRRSLYDLPLGETPLWRLRERRAQVTTQDGREERCTAVLPAWSARSEHDLTGPDLGFESAASALAGLLVGHDLPYEAKQSAMARYSRIGFEAAAVTAVAALLSMPISRDGVLREAELRFGHPYAVVAVATQRRGEGPGPWDGLPVFSAWVADVTDAEDEPG